MMKTYFKISFLFLALLFISCDKDFNTVGSDLIGDEHFIHGVDTDVTVKAYTVPTGEVQTNNLPINPLGIYDNAVFGKTKANFVTELTLNSTNPSFGTNIEMENVVLYIPFFSQVKSSAADGSKTYALDSIYGATQSNLENKKMKLSVFENGYFLNTTDPSDNFQSLQKYYSDLDATINTWKKGNDGNGNSVANGTRLNDSQNTAENDQFYFNDDEIIVYKRKLINGNYVYVDASGNQLANQNDPSLRVIDQRLAPGIYLELNKAFFKKKILEASSDNLFNNNAFRNYFRGLYFKLEEISPGQGGALALLNFSNAKLDIYYKSISSGATESTSKIVNISMGTASGANCVSLQDNTFSTIFSTGLNEPGNNLAGTTVGQNQKLYLKGGNGSVVYIDLFGDAVDANGTPLELLEYRANDWLINDAYLNFYVDQAALTSLSKREEPLRLYLFDATNNKPLVDYTLDTSTGISPKKSKVIHGGIIQVDSNGKGINYKIKLTNHINNLFNSSNVNLNKNVRLGLCVTETIATTSNYYFKNVKNIRGQQIAFFPITSIFSPLGTILHGTNATDAAKRLKLVINYTKPN